MDKDTPNQHKQHARVNTIRVRWVQYPSTTLFAHCALRITGSSQIVLGLNLQTCGSFRGHGSSSFECPSRLPLLNLLHLGDPLIGLVCDSLGWEWLCGHNGPLHRLDRVELVSCKTGRIGLKYDQHLVEHSFESMSKLRVNQARSLACFRHHCESLTTSLVWRCL